ncbi:MAG: exodeoxyribonuclease VII large subunit [Elusimicrobiota bacterium]
MNFTEKIYTVTQINRLSKNLLEKEFTSVWIEGEISNFKHHSSGHMYFTIKDENSSIDAIMYKNLNQSLRFMPERGIKVLVKGTISIFERAGRYQVVVWEMKERGKGELEKKYLQLKEKLKKEGLFDKKHKKSLPQVPQLIGLVTSPTGAAIRDILKVIKRRFSNVDLIVYPARVQGDTAAGEICTGIGVLNEIYPEMDVIIIGRGGGSIEDLWPFNEESLARTIFKSKIPVISAVGHEIDFTISDFVADTRAPTPSAAAELVIKNKEELTAKINKMSETLISSIKNKYINLKNRLEGISGMSVYVYPYRFIDQKEQELDYLVSDINKNIEHNLEVKEHKLTGIKSLISSLSPGKTLERGYSITYHIPTGEIVNSYKNIKVGEEIKTIFAKGEAESKITKTKRSSNGE